MVIYVSESGSDRTELTEALAEEGVSFKESSRQSVREMGTASWRMLEIQANLPEVYPVPPEFAQSDGDVRVWRLPSGRLIISDMEGNLERIATPPPTYGR
jgi:hypothetical protein